MKLGCWPTYEHKHKLLTPDAAQTVYLRAVPHSRIGTPPPYWIIAHGFASPQRSGSVSDVGVARLHFSSTNHFPERICAVIKRTGLLVEIIIKKLNNVKIRLFHISIQCYLFWKSDEKWVWFLKPVQAGWHAHLEHFSTTGSQRRVLHINCTCIMSYFFFCSHGTYGVTHWPCTHFLKAEAAGRLRLYGGAGCSPLPHDGSSSDGLCVCLTRPVWEDMMCGSEDIYSSTSACINSWFFLKVPEIKR